MLFRGQKLALSSEVLIGRNPACHLFIGDDALVSRRHARITVEEDGAFIEDLGSANGVFVDEMKVEGKVPLVGGNRIRIGKSVFEIQAGPESQAPRSNRDVAPTQESAPPEDLTATVSDTDSESHSEVTSAINVFELLGGVVDKALSIGNKEEAERILLPVLQKLRAETQETGAFADGMEAHVNRYALKMATATGKGFWVDELIGTYASIRRPLPTGTTDKLYQLVRNLDRLDVDALRDYLDDLRTQLHRFGPAERFACKRLEGLEKIASLK